MLARGLIISRRLAQVRTAPKHRYTHISNYQSSEHESNQHVESDYMKFPCTLKNIAYHKRAFRPVLCHKRIGLPCCTLFNVTVTCLLQIIFLSNNLLPTISVLAENTLLKTTCNFLLLLVGFSTLTYRKDYDWYPILVGYQGGPWGPLGTRACHGG